MYDARYDKKSFSDIFHIIYFFDSFKRGYNGEDVIHLSYT